MVFDSQIINDEFLLIMEIQVAIDLFRNGLLTTLLVSAPILIVGLAVGLMVSIFQAITQVHEMTLTFIPKIVAIFITLIIFLPWMVRVLVDFTLNVFLQMPGYIK